MEGIFNFDYWLVAKGLLLLFTFGYLLFSLIVLRQVQIMNKVLKTTLSGWIKTLGFFHFLFALGVFFWIFFLF